MKGIDIEIEFDMINDCGLAFELLNVFPVTTSDYEKLNNLPSINGKTLIGNYDEEDPTVSKWAKEPNKPSYTPDEVGAIDANDEISFADILDLWNNVFI